MRTNVHYAKLSDGYPVFLVLPVQLKVDIVIGGTVHPAGAWLSTDDETILLQLGYKPVIRTKIPEDAGYYYTETWSETEKTIIQGWEEHPKPQEDEELADAVNALEMLGYAEEEDNGQV